MNKTMKTSINIEMIEQIENIKRAFDNMGVRIDAIEYDDETIIVVSYDTKYIFECSSDDDEMPFVNVNDKNDIVIVSI